MNKQQPQKADSLTPDRDKMRKESQHWLSEIRLWQVELNFFQKLLDEHAPKMNTIGEKKAFDFLQDRNHAFDAMFIPPFRKKVKAHHDALGNGKPTTNAEALLATHIAMAHEYSGLRADYAAYKAAFTQLIDQVKNIDAMSSSAHARNVL